MNTCADEACAVALALKASGPDKDEQRRLGGGEVAAAELDTEEPEDVD